MCARMCADILRCGIVGDCFVVRPENSDDNRNIGSRGAMCLMHISKWGITLALQVCYYLGTAGLLLPQHYRCVIILALQVCYYLSTTGVLLSWHYRCVIILALQVCYCVALQMCYYLSATGVLLFWHYRYVIMLALQVCYYLSKYYRFVIALALQVCYYRGTTDVLLHLHYRQVIIIIIIIITIIINIIIIILTLIAFCSRQHKAAINGLDRRIVCLKLVHERTMECDGIASLNGYRYLLEQVACLVWISSHLGASVS